MLIHNPRLPLRTKLPLFISLLLCLVVAALSWLAYGQLKQALIAGAEQRVVSAAQQVGGMLHESLLRVRRDAARQASSADVVRVLERSTPGAQESATRTLEASLATNPQLVAASLWSRTGTRVLAVGSLDAIADRRAAAISPVPPRSLSAGAWATPLRASGDSVAYDIVAPSLGASGDTAGYLVETRRLSGQGAQRIRSLIGLNSTFLLGNREGGFWTDLSRQVEGPELASDVDIPLSYARADTARIAAQDAVASAPWIVAIEMPRRMALAPARRFLVRAGVIALILVIFGALAAWTMSRSITQRLEALTRAAEGMSAGDYAQRLPSGGGDELARLSSSFNTMAERVATSSRALEQQAIEARATAEQLEGANQELACAFAEAEEARQAAVRASREREETLAQLQQAQKMEAVGQLAGGVAHDFNNLLTVITSYSTMLLGDLPVDSRHAEDVREIQSAANRASALTRQLLAFSRRQMLQPRVLDLNLVMRNLERMLRRLLREDIELVASLTPELGFVSADPGQLEQIVVNLAVNARDAMPGGGRLTIATSRVEHRPEPARSDRSAVAHLDAPAGTYVVLAVSDTGHGMDEATRAQIFDPFFTTKPVGQGTGLGLATVYGIVKQSGGYIRVSSAPGRGTTFSIYLPAVEGEAPATPSSGAAGESAPGSAERILLVEDEPNVRRIARRMLERGGYTVVEAANGVEALRIVETRREPIALVLTDVVMPEMGGRELAARLQAVSPTSRVLFMSGYSEDAVLHQQLVAAEARLLEKPFTLESLTRKVRETLTAP